MQTDDPFLLERAILKLAFEREEVRIAIAPIIDPSWFFDEGLKRTAKSIAGFVTEYGDFPSKSDMRLLIGDDETATDSFKEVIKTDVSDYTPDHLLDGIQDYIKRKLITESTRALQDSVSEGADDEELDKLTDMVEASRGFKFVMEQGLNVFGDTDSLWEDIHSEHNFLKTNVVALNKNMKGGVARGHTTCFFAEAGFGKTAVLGSLAVGMALNGAKVLFITMELSKGYLGTRLVQSALGKTNEEVWRYSKEQLKEELTKGVNADCANNMYVEEIPPGSNTYAIKKILKDYARKGIKFDAVVTDYLQLMTSTRKLNGTNSNDLMKWVTIELNAYAKTFDFAHLTAAQVNRTGYDRSDFGMDAVAEGISIAQNVSAIWGLMATEEQGAMGHITMKSLKNRFGRKNVKEICTLNFELMQLRDIDQAEANAMAVQYASSKGVEAGRAPKEEKPKAVGFMAKKQQNRSVQGISV